MPKFLIRRPQFRLRGHAQTSSGVTSTTILPDAMSYAVRLFGKKKTVKQTGKKKTREKFFITDRRKALKIQKSERHS